jgi:hypothetical protein
LDYLEASTSTAVGPGLIIEAIKDECMCFVTGVALNTILVKSYKGMILDGMVFEGVIDLYNRIGTKSLKKRALFCSQGATLDTVNTVPVPTSVNEEGRDVLTGAARRG